MIRRIAFIAAAAAVLATPALVQAESLRASSSSLTATGAQSGAVDSVVRAGAGNKKRANRAPFKPHPAAVVAVAGMGGAIVAIVASGGRTHNPHSPSGS